MLLTLKRYKESQKNIVVLLSSNFKANEFYNSLVNFIPKEDIILFLENDLIRVEYISESKDIVANRIYALNEMINSKHKIYILTPPSIYRFYPSKEEFIEATLKLKVGDTINFSELIKKLNLSGYNRVNKVDASLQFAFRGDVVDLFSINYDNPIRIEFFDDQIESIRFFDIAKQESILKIEEIEILPSTTMIFTSEEKENFDAIFENRKNIDLLRIRKDLKDIFLAQISEDLDELNKNKASTKLYKYYGILKKTVASPFSYLDDFEEIIIEKDEILEAKERLFKESYELLIDLFDSGRSFSSLELFNKNNEIIIPKKKKFYINSLFFNEKEVNIPLSSPFLQTKKGLNFDKIVDLYLFEFKQVVFVIKNNEEFNKLSNYLKFIHKKYKLLNDFNDELDEINVIYSVSSLSFESKENSFALINSSILFNSKKVNFAYSSKFKEGIILGNYEELEKGDFVVHEMYGIGQFVGVEEIELSGNKEDYLKIIYKNNDTLFVPLYSFDLIRKYSGQEGKIPTLSSLHSDQWKKTKKKIKDKVNDLADKLLVLYKERNLEEGFQFKGDSDLEEEFNNAFPFELTADQKKSMEEIKEDMESRKIMDRLLCGDVGFGKTEIAFRAAFKAIISGKQVLLLAPTTLLAKQHYEVALDRFSKFGVRIKLLTRNQSYKETNEIIEELALGEVNLLIGTHKTLSKKVIFKDLGLLIIDEEQRFGVEQKEKLKIDKANIDCLTLSATPIPRTLQSSLIGLKSVSTIQTPPKERVPIQIYVIERDMKVLKEVILREINREGQVFYVHNRIDDIYELSSKLSFMIPEITIGVIHGKMNKEEANEIMTSFYLGDIDLLLSTSIIENGIDVRNANLMIVDNADRFGLSQLYQIKGRVGRGDRMAMCYLLIDSKKELNDEAKKRLKAIQDFTELGSGYKIAQRDLLIRGAGDILGSEQAGFIDEVGIDLYLKLLNEAINEKKYGQISKEDERVQKTVEIKNAYIPSDFAKDGEKIELYQKLAEANTFEKIEKLKEEIKDNYGKIPDQLDNLLRQREIDIYLNYDEFAEIKNTLNTVNIVLSKSFSNINGIGTELFMDLIDYVSKLKITYLNKMITILINKDTNYEKTLKEVIKIIHSEAIKHEI